MSQGKFRRIFFTDIQMMAAHQSGKFDITREGMGHRQFVAWLFLKQHNCIVESFTKLKYTYLVRNKTAITQVEGVIGHALVEK
jgi:hypothetical protein